MPALRRRHEELRPHLREDITHHLLERLRAGELDAAILSLPVDDAGLELAPLAEEPFLLALPCGHRLAARSRIAEADLEGERVLVLEEGHCLRDQTAPLCRRLRLYPDGGLVATTVESLRLMVGAGLGLAILPAFAATGPFAGATEVVYRPFPEPIPSRTLALAWRLTLPHGDALRALAATLRTELADALAENTAA